MMARYFKCTPPLMSWVLTLVLILSSFTHARAQGMTLVRDAEIERTLRLYADPIFEAAYLPPESINLFIIKDDNLNAFVAGGRNMAFHTGLLRKLESPSEIIGVIAHETGHIAGGHLTRRGLAMQNATGPMIVSTLLGIAAAAAGAGQAGAAIMAGGQQVAQRSFLKFNRSEESSADQASIDYLERAGIRTNGILSVLKELQKQEVFLSSRRDPYALTHPLSQNRIRALEQRVQNASTYNKPEDPELVYWHQRMQAKLDGFLLSPGRTLSNYPDDDSEPALLARAVAYHRTPLPQQAIATVDRLIQKRSNDPYYLELKGQILLEGGDARAAIPAYRRALQIAPYEPLIAVPYAQALLAMNENASSLEAQKVLRSATLKDPLMANAWRQLAIVEARLGNEGQAAHATAEFQALRGRFKQAKIHAERAIKLLPVGSANYLKANDLLALLEQRS